MRTVPSPLADRSCCDPSARKSIQLTAPPWPRRLTSSWPSWASQSLTVPSPLPTTARSVGPCRPGRGRRPPRPPGSAARFSGLPSRGIFTAQMAHLLAIHIGADGVLVVLVVGLRPELGLAHQLVPFLALAAADHIERVLVVALANNLDGPTARQDQRL